MIHSIAVLELAQPIGSFYLGKIDSAILIRITKTVRRNANDGIQRELSGKRAKEISKYCEDPDAACLFLAQGNHMDCHHILTILSYTAPFG